MRRSLAKLHVLHQHLTGYRTVLSSQHQNLEIANGMVNDSVLRASEMKSPPPLDCNLVTDPLLRILGDILLERLSCGISHAHRHLATVRSLQVIDDPVHLSGTAVLPDMIEKPELRRLGEIKSDRNLFPRQSCQRKHR